MTELVRHDYVAYDVANGTVGYGGGIEIELYL